MTQRGGPPDEIQNKRTRLLVENLVKGAAENDGVLSDAVKIAAVEATYHYSAHGTPWPPELALRKANIYLKKPDVKAGMRGLYLGAAGFSVVEATQLHVAHMRGTLTRKRALVVKNRDGDERIEVVDEAAAAPSYPALKDYLAVASHTPTKQVENKNLNVNVSAPPPREGAPVMSARIIGAPRALPRATEPPDED